jgi:hypothetical protein
MEIGVRESSAKRATFSEATKDHLLVGPYLASISDFEETSTAIEHYSARLVGAVVKSSQPSYQWVFLTSLQWFS